MKKNFNYQEYRDDLARDLKATRTDGSDGKLKAQQLLEETRETEEYQEAKEQKDTLNWTPEEFQKRNLIKREGEATILRNYAFNEIELKAEDIDISNNLLKFGIDRNLIDPKDYFNQAWGKAKNHRIREGHLGADDQGNISYLFRQVKDLAISILDRDDDLPDEFLDKILEKNGYHESSILESRRVSFANIGVLIAEKKPEFAKKLEEIYLSNHKYLDAAKISAALGDVEKSKELLRKFCSGKGYYTEYSSEHGWYSARDTALIEFIKTAENLEAIDILKEDVKKLLEIANGSDGGKGSPWYDIAGKELEVLVNSDPEFVKEIWEQVLKEE